MSDRSYVSIAVYACTPDDWPEFIEILQRHMGCEDIPYPDKFPFEFIEEEAGVGSLAAALIEVSKKYPSIIFWGEQDSSYEYYGDRCIQVEEGFFHAETDNAGNVGLSVGVIDDLARQGDLHTKIHEYIGTKYLDAAREWKQGTRTPQYVIEEMSP